MNLFFALPLSLAAAATPVFKESYEESRQSFLTQVEELRKQEPRLELHSFEIPNTKNENLVMDALYLPPSSGKKNRLLILTSGIHGIEGFVGSALQNLFMQESFWNQRDPDLGILIVHALNPYGFKFERRVSEHNVDLNRNFDTNSDLFNLKNEGYQKVRELLNPSTPAPSGIWSRCGFYFQAVVAILQHSMDSLRRAVLKGQYEFPEGIYFGGQDFEPQKNLLENEFLKRGKGYQHVLLIDLHTGYGQRGQLHLFANRSPVIDADYLTKVFAGHPLDFGQKKDFYEVTGGLVVFAGKIFQQKSKYAGMVFEFGTLDSQKTLGSLDSIYRMVRENQLSHHGTHSEAEGQEIRHLFREMFYPSAPEWREAVTTQFRALLSDALKNQRNLASPSAVH